MGRGLRIEVLGLSFHSDTYKRWGGEPGRAKRQPNEAVDMLKGHRLLNVGEKLDERGAYCRRMMPWDVNGDNAQEHFFGCTVLASLVIFQHVLQATNI